MGQSGSRTNGRHNGSVLLWASDLKRMLLVGPAKGAPSCRRSTRRRALGARLRLRLPRSEAACTPTTKRLTTRRARPSIAFQAAPCCTHSALSRKPGRLPPGVTELEGLRWHSMACDTVGSRLVVVGTDKKADNLGRVARRSTTSPSGKWSRLEVADQQVVRLHRELVAAQEAVLDLVGRIRLAWYRDPKGVGTAAELAALGKRCESIREMPPMTFAERLLAVADLLAGGKTLDALRSAREVQRKIEESPKPSIPYPARRNSPLTFEEKNQVFVLFGGDHEDYLMNDTWVLDLAKRSWRRSQSRQAPRPPRRTCAPAVFPRAARLRPLRRLCPEFQHGLRRRPLCRRSAHSSSGSSTRRPIARDLVASSSLPPKADRTTPAALGFFDGYANERFCPPALAVDANDLLVLAAHPCGPWYWRWKRLSETWVLAVDPARVDAAGRETLGVAPNQRLYRKGPFLAAFCEVPDGPKGDRFGPAS